MLEENGIHYTWDRHEADKTNNFYAYTFFRKFVETGEVTKDVIYVLGNHEQFECLLRFWDNSSKDWDYSIFGFGTQKGRKELIENATKEIHDKVMSMVKNPPPSRSSRQWYDLKDFIRTSIEGILSE